MKKILFLALIATFLSATNLSKDTIKTALNYAVKELSTNGFINSKIAKIPLPKNLELAANLARKIGGDKWANELTQKINLSATKAVTGASEVLFNDIKNMNEKTLINLVSGSSDSFTNYFKNRSSKELEKVFKPIISNMMKDSTFANAYNKLNSFASNKLSSKENSAINSVASLFGASDYLPKKNENLNDYITNKTIDGLFKVMKTKEQSIKQAPLFKGVKFLDKFFN